MLKTTNYASHYMQIFQPSVNILLEALCLGSSLKVKGQISLPLMTRTFNVRYEFLMDVIIKIVVVRNLKAYRTVNWYRHFGGNILNE
jgi:hypothetical protein